MSWAGFRACVVLCRWLTVAQREPGFGTLLRWVQRCNSWRLFTGLFSQREVLGSHSSGCLSCFPLAAPFQLLAPPPLLQFLCPGVKTTAPTHSPGPKVSSLKPMLTLLFPFKTEPAFLPLPFLIILHTQVTQTRAVPSGLLPHHLGG